MNSLDEFESDLAATAPQASDSSSTPAPVANSFEQDLQDTAPGQAKKRMTTQQAIDLVNQRDLNDYSATGQGAAYGAGDIPRSLQRIGANIADLFTGGHSADDVAAENQKRNDDFNALANKDPATANAMGAGRFMGQMAATSPVFAGTGAVAQGIADMGGAGPFLAGQSENPLLWAPSRVLAGANTGAQVTALTNAGSNATLPSQFEGNMLTGGAMHAGVPALAGGADLIRDAMTAPDDFAANKISQNMLRDGLTSSQDLRDSFDNMGSQGSLADTGPNMMRLARAMQTQPSEGSGAFENFLNERQEGQGSRLLEAAHAGLGTGQDFNQQMNDLVNQRAQNAAPLYQQAFAQNKAIVSPGIDKILSTPAGNAALADARVKMQNDMSMMGAPDAELGEQARQQGIDAPGGVAPGLNMRTLDYVKRSFDDQIGAAQRAGANDNARILSTLKSSLVNQMDAADVTAKNGQPGLYAQARAAYSGPSQSMEALEAGQNFMKNDATMNQSQLANMPDQDKQFFRIGVAKSMQDQIDGTPDGADAVKRIFGSPAKRAKLASVFHDDETFNQFANVAQNESQFYKTRAAILNRSQTTPGAAESQDAGATFGNAVGDVMHAKSNPIGFGLSKVQNMLTNAGKMSAEKSNALAPYFTDQGKALSLGKLQSGNLSNGSYLGKYVNMLAGAYGIPATEMAAQRMSPDATQ